VSRDTSRPIGVLLMAHGTPESLDEMTEYLTRVRGGRPPSDELIEEMRHNYAAIGGRSPLTDLTRAQATALGAELGPGFVVAAGMRNWRPFIESAVADLRASDVAEIVGIPLAPQFSTLSVRKYVDAARAVMPGDLPFVCVRSFCDHPLLIEAFASRLAEAGRADEEEIVFTAHSLPVRVVADGDPYARLVAKTAEGVAARANLARWSIAYQSAGRTPEPWLGPDLSDFVRERAGQGTKRLLVVPIGFVCDHTEILYDIDVQAARAARECGVGLRRTGSLNTSPIFIRMLADLVRRTASRLQGRTETIGETELVRSEGPRVRGS
jgi:ferrochelatase